MPRCHILLVGVRSEDEPALAAALTELGYRVTCATTPDAAALLDKPDADLDVAFVEARQDAPVLSRGPIPMPPTHLRPALLALVDPKRPELRGRALGAGMDDVLGYPLDATAVDHALSWYGTREPPLDTARVATLQSLDDAAPGLWSDLPAAFVDQYHTRATAMVQAAATGDRAASAKAAHGLKGASREVGATRLAAVLASLEQDPSHLQASMRYVRFEALRVAYALSQRASVGH